MHNVVSFFILLSLSQSVLAQTAEKAREFLNREERNATLRKRLEPRISDKYYLGRFLIYDCEHRHFACVNVESFFSCTQNREEEIQNKDTLLSCAPFKQYESLEDCTNAYLGFIYRRTDKSFCMNKVTEKSF
ncbi:hypothetical protein [Halobacteriovorax sp.]|uniref:hypothetical protein n=1 Tax=Halobacteriovorax sp. TaxID=2020862 RepID=UPI0035663362